MSLINSVKSLSSTSVEILFNYKMDKSSTEAAINYAINEMEGNGEKLDVISASLDSTGKRVVLTTGVQKGSRYNIIVRNVSTIYGEPSSNTNMYAFDGISN